METDADAYRGCTETDPGASDGGEEYVASHVRREILLLRDDNERIMEEIKQLEGQISWYKDKCSSMKREIARLTEEFAKLSSGVDESPEDACTKVLRLPELLEPIFEHVFPPNELLDHSLSRGPNSPWCQALRDKKSVILVCRTWRSMAIPLLYKNIALRRFPQLRLFLRTLRRSSVLNLPSMVNSLSIEGCIPLCSFWELEESLKNIIIMCPRLTKLALSPDFLVAEEFRYLNLAPLLIARSTLTELSLGRSIPLSFCVLDFLGSMPQLQALSLYVGSTTQAELVYMDPACLAKLERLWLYLTDGCSLDCLAMLQTPSLIHLTVAGWGSGRMEDIMRVRGRNLKFLSLDTWSSMTDDRAAVSHCPVLEHLVVNQNTTVRSHPNLRFLDIWHCPEEDAPDWTPEPALFSNLERVRILDWSLKNIPNLLDVLPPTRDTDKDLRLLLPGAVVWDCPTRILEEEYVPSRGIVATYLPRNLGEFCRTDDRESSEQDDFDDSDDESYVYSSVPTSPWSCSSSASEIVEALKL